MKTIAVIPAFNEKGRIGGVLRDVVRHVDQIVVVDDGSSEPVAQFVHSDPKITVLRHRINLGKGAALKTGCEAAKKLGADTIVCMDSDGQHSPQDIPKFLHQLEKEQCDIVFGSRKIGKDMPLMMMLGNKFLSITMSLLFGIYVSDTQSGFRVFRTSAYPKLAWESPRYAVETEMIVNAGKHKLRWRESEIETIYHDKYKGTTVFDGIRIFLQILKWRLI